MIDSCSSVDFAGQLSIQMEYFGHFYLASKAEALEA